MSLNPNIPEQKKKKSRKNARREAHKPTQGALSPDMARKLIGRPSTYDPTYAQELLNLSAEGYSFAGFAGKMGIARSTVNDWRASYSEFDEACARASAARAYAWETKAIRAVDSGLSGPLTFIAFALKNCAPDDWKEKIESVVTHQFTLAGLIEESMQTPPRMIDVSPVKPLEQEDNPAIEPAADTTPNS